MLLRFAVLVGGTHKARIIAILLVLHFGLAALNHFIEIGEIERDRQSLEAQFPDLGVACYDYIPWLIALSVTIFFAILLPTEARFVVDLLSRNGGRSPART